jgi:hypothetical protein
MLPRPQGISYGSKIAEASNVWTRVKNPVPLKGLCGTYRLLPHQSEEARLGYPSCRLALFNFPSLC